MGLLNVAENARKPVVIKTLRNQCYDYTGAYGYFCDRVKEMQAAAEKNKDKEGIPDKSQWTWVSDDDDGKGWYVAINLHSMPLYWNIEYVIKDGKKEQVDIWGPKQDPKTDTPLEVRNKLLGMTKYNVESQDAGIELLQALAANEDEDFKKILTTAAKALQVVDDQELPHIRQKAEMLYTEWHAAAISQEDNPKLREDAVNMGAWGYKDDTGKSGQAVFSKEKTNKMNQFKQTARRQLGYERAKAVEEKRATYG